MNAGSIAKSEQGALAFLWATGRSPQRTAFGQASATTQGLRDSSFSRDYVGFVSSGLANGRSTFQAGGYDAGDPLPWNPNLRRDIAAIADWQSASNVDRSLAVVGSFDLEAKLIQRGQDSATVMFIASNSMTLGSGISPVPEWRPFINSIPGDAGPFSQVSQTFIWTESVTW
jgi:hypothetical protein